ncbi:type II toxin-antitoxin system RelE/ParE family toxin [Neisseria sp. 83E34]|uniref:type II toxin-antitoxin system RelE/ParE family toxin n=1 Tax=Neisseria sp. 83E34 TaxID=1692264 RepID=UPI0006CE94B1|nr:type II toxin-antitoxin system RelE/ParE family toxin [Neisseria sp. 83E34]KPN72629.1 hypothetical protein AKG09_02010 [Neisseria sp. 83E34]
MYRIIYEPEAESDLLSVLSYYADEGGISLAEIISRRIETALEGLAYFPYRAVESALVEGTREYFVGNLPYTAFIKIDENSKTVYVLNIVHTARKFP